MTGHKIYGSSNGDRWFLIRSPEGQPLEVEHRANAASGGAITRHSVTSFLLPGNTRPEHQALRDMLHDGTAWPMGAEIERLSACLDQLRVLEEGLLACRSEFSDVGLGGLERRPLVIIEGISLRLSGITQLEAVLAAMHRALEIESAHTAARLGSFRKPEHGDVSYDSVEP